jgi:hypothetical protein
LSSWNVLTKVDFNIIIWTDESIEIFLRTNYVFALDAFLNSRNHAEAADIARYLIIYHYGGHYIDWDVQLLNPNKFLKICQKYPLGYFVIDPINGTLASEVFGSKAGSEYLFKLTKDIVQLFSNGLRNNLATPQYSGPYRMRDSLNDYGRITQALLPVKSIFAYDYTEIREMKSKKITQPMIHYWLHSWVK